MRVPAQAVAPCLGVASHLSKLAPLVNESCWSSLCRDSREAVIAGIARGFHVLPITLAASLVAGVGERPR